jgi:hypothetical protein
LANHTSLGADQGIFYLREKQSISRVPSKHKLESQRTGMQPK